MCRYAFLSIVVASMGTAQSAWLFKNLRGKQIAKASMAAITLSGCAGAAMALAAALYYGVMRVAGAHILEECMQFLKGKR